jgi:hypothetical protein
MRTYSSIIALTTVVSCVAACGNGNDNDNDTTEVRVVAGVYDATVDLGAGAFASTGVVDSGPEGASIRLELGNDASVTFGGPVASEGSMTGPGTFLVTDILFQGTGEATFGARAGIDIVTGSVTAPDASIRGFDHVAFSMRRPADANASGFSGTYRFTLAPSPSVCSCTSTLDLALTFDASGISTIGAATERAEDGTSVASLMGVSSSLSPEGRLRVTASYEPADDPQRSGVVALIGVLDASGAVTTASGDTFAGFTPASRIGTWTADRIE